MSAPQSSSRTKASCAASGGHAQTQWGPEACHMSYAAWICLTWISNLLIFIRVLWSWHPPKISNQSDGLRIKISKPPGELCHLHHPKPPILSPGPLGTPSQLPGSWSGQSPPRAVDLEETTNPQKDPTGWDPRIVLITWFKTFQNLQARGCKVKPNCSKREPIKSYLGITTRFAQLGWLTIPW